ncbi:piggyBac transposable element-derived protein 2-like [Hydra vulgaris]|uniref:PiggyBac transposable element-derived protein 2-like n=1 Tax=Hydra vulgaris TaxID=6087 RepID=A0ABM4BV72_HYDVU
MCFILNFFTSFELMKDLKEKNIAATGTVRSNRMNSCPIKSDNEMKKEHRGAFDYCFDVKNQIFGVVWKDNNCVKMLSNHQALQPLQKVSRWSRTEKKQVKIPQLQCIQRYNKYMDGMDKLDWYINKYRIEIRLMKWNFSIFTNLIDMTGEHTCIILSSKQYEHTAARI